MSVPATTLRKLASLSLSSEQMAGVLDILADGIEAEEARKEAQRQRTKRAREKQRGNVTASLQSRNGNGDDTRGRVTPVEDKSLTTELEPQKEEKKETRVRAFDAFWAIYPHKVGKGEAVKAFARAEQRVDLETLMAGLRRYVAKTDDRPWCNPSTWLNQDRWTDEPAAPVARAGPSPPRMNPTLVAARNLMDQLNAVTPSEIEGHQPSPRLVAIGGRGG